MFVPVVKPAAVKANLKRYQEAIDTGKSVRVTYTPTPKPGRPSEPARRRTVKPISVEITGRGAVIVQVVENLNVRSFRIERSENVRIVK